MRTPPSTGDWNSFNARRLARRLLLLYVPLATVALVLALALIATTYLPGEVGLIRDVQGLQWTVATTVMVWISALGYFPLSFLVPIVVIAILAARRYWLEAGMIVLGQASNPLARVVKEVVGRERPSPDLYWVYQIVQDPSFPSGHVVYFTTFYGFLFVLVWTRWRPSLARTAVLGLLGALVVLVGVSRVYLGAHYPADVVGGYLIGGIWLALVIDLYNWRRQAKRSH